MNATLLKALLAFVPVAALCAYSVRAFSRQRTAWSSLLLAGSACLVVAILTHVAEALHLFPAMGWGEPRSIGHYVDLSSAVFGVTLLAVGFTLRPAMPKAQSFNKVNDATGRSAPCSRSAARDSRERERVPSA